MHSIGHNWCNWLASIVVLMFLGSCERTIEARCLAEAVEACCLLSRAEAESSVGIGLRRSRAWENERESGCLYATSNAGFAEILILRSFENSRSEGVGTDNFLPRVSAPEWEDISIAGVEAKIFWQPATASKSEEDVGALFVLHPETFFRIRTNPLGRGFPDWKRPRDVARRVLRNLEARDS